MLVPRLIRSHPTELAYRTAISTWWLRGLCALGLVTISWGCWTWSQQWGWVRIGLGAAMAIAAVQLEFVDLTLDLQQQQYALRRKDVLGARRSTGSFHQFECVEMRPVKHWTGLKYGAFLQWKRGSHRLVRAHASAPRRGSVCLELHRSKRTARRAIAMLAQQLRVPQSDRTRDPIDLP
ncbi:MAG: hypothetical protein AAF704_16750 [Cyanobacteria bacterium P01_D01_bin.123]